MPFFTANLYLKKPTETEEFVQDDYNDNMDTLDRSLSDHTADGRAHGLTGITAQIASHSQDLAAHGAGMSCYRLHKDSAGVFTETQWKRAGGTLARRTVLSNGTPPCYTTKTITFYDEDGMTIKAIKEYALTYDEDNDLISEVLLS